MRVQLLSRPAKRGRRTARQSGARHHQGVLHLLTRTPDGASRFGLAGGLPDRDGFHVPHVYEVLAEVSVAAGSAGPFASTGTIARMRRMFARRSMMMPAAAHKAAAMPKVRAQECV